MTNFMLYILIFINVWGNLFLSVEFIQTGTYKLTVQELAFFVWDTTGDYTLSVSDCISDLLGTIYCDEKISWPFKCCFVAS